MGLDDLTQDDDSEPQTYQAGQEYRVEYCGHFVTPVFEITPTVPDIYIEDNSDYTEATRTWIQEKDPLMGPEQFKLFFEEQSKSVFSGETELRAQTVVKTTNIHDEWRKDPEDVELGFNYLSALYYNDTHYYDGELSFRRAESMMQSDLERWVKQVKEIFKDTPYSVYQYTLIPHKAGDKPLDKKYERY